MKLFKTLLGLMTAATLTVAPLVNADQQVRLESQVNVANVTNGDTQYQKSVNAKVDDVVKIQLWYHNMENADSGLVAKNLKVAIALPTAAGKTQTVTSTVSSDNSNTVTDTANINLTLDNASLQYIPGSAQWRHDIGTNAAPNYVTTTISDNVVNGGVNLGDEQPCFNFQATVTILARVIAPVVSIVKEVKVDGQTGAKYVTQNDANPGDTLDYVFIVKNESNTTLTQVQVGDNLPPHLTYVPGSTRLVNGVTGSAGMSLADGITSGGITISDMLVGSTQYVYFKVKVDSQAQMPCGNTQLNNVGIVKAKGTNQIYNTAITNVNNVCQTTPPPSTPPTTPQQPLPQTGPETALAGVFGTGALGYATRAYLRSKRAVVDSLKSIAQR